MDRKKTVPPPDERPKKLFIQKSVRSVYVFAALACVITFFTLFHEISHSYILSLPSAGGHASFYSCLLHSCGAFAGAVLCLAPSVSRFIRTHRRAFLTIVCWMLVAFGAIYGFELFVNASAIGTHAAETVGAALCTMYAVELIAWQSQLDTRTLAIGLAGVIAVCACGSYLVFPLITQLFSPVEVSAFQCTFAVGALILTFKGLPAKSRPDEPSEETYPNTMPPNGSKRETAFPDGISSIKRFFANLSKHWALVLHPLAYGFTFGVLHETVGIFRLMGAGRNYLEFVGAMLAALLVLATYLRPVATAREVWTNLRRLAFPLLTGFVIIPALMNSVAATIFADTATCYYGCLFVLGCTFMAKETDISPLTIVGSGIALLSLGLVLGSLCGFLPYLLNRFQDPLFLSAAIMVAFIATTIGTFWIGDDHALRTWWGLRRKYTAKQYKDQLVRSKCERVARDYNLSDRECEVLLLLAQGRRPVQIKDDLFISINTTRVHIRNIYNKLDVHSVKQLTDLVDGVVL